MESVILVDKENVKTGLSEKLAAHKNGLLHRAFSILIYNQNREFLLQRRASSKYHTPNLWTNTCCSHPYDSESYEDAINRRLYEEMGMKCKLFKEFDFIYKAKFSNNLIEHEHDTVFIGESNQLPTINKDEVGEYQYISYADLRKQIDMYPEQYTPWFMMIMDKVDSNFFNHKNFYYA